MIDILKMYLILCKKKKKYIKKQIVGKKLYL